jgi:hypothetical protein
MERSVNAGTRVRFVLAAVAALVGCADQPEPKCSVARGNFAATYTLISGEGECAELKGEILGVQAYNARTSKTDPTPDYDHTSIGIQPQSITDFIWGGATDEDSKHKPFALGKFSSKEPDSQGFCAAPKLSVSRFSSAEVPEQSDACTTTPALPAVDFKYEFSDVRVYSTVAALGTQLSATLNYTKDGCSAKYRVRAVYPAVSCAGAGPVPPATDAAIMSEEDAGAEATATEDDAGSGGDAGVECPPAEPPSGPPVPDATLCSPDPDPDQGRPIGSGLNADFDIRCDPDLLLCVLKKEPPALR